jgi:hypothetical protein
MLLSVPADHLQSVRMNFFQNHWSHIYDFTPQNGNWSYLPPVASLPLTMPPLPIQYPVDLTCGVLTLRVKSTPSQATSSQEMLTALGESEAACSPNADDVRCLPCMSHDFDNWRHTQIPTHINWKLCHSGATDYLGREGLEVKGVNPYTPFPPPKCPQHAQAQTYVRDNIDPYTFACYHSLTVLICPRPTHPTQEEVSMRKYQRTYKHAHANIIIGPFVHADYRQYAHAHTRTFGQ